MGQRQKQSILFCTTGFIVAVSLLLIGCSKTEIQKDEVAVVNSLVVKSEKTGQGASYSGEVRGRYESQLAFQVGGKIIKRHVDLGSVVNANWRTG
ncbi:hypothetical protein [Sporomusa acidovorans]|uniref:Uncharacterized protein n=1 Tax=Sporomusa acidovorans (strain ATCC 49682 / DSM 3132 / Mol) TaxID=1123286 RepID=A0ABZ3J5M8_SPOA4|nr:hypothetical protein SPACI_35110 [Sporomusa acidovorans DSM 3132]SDF25592.1 hypothetical protein SAMN04488499_104010 [Sporomusa acidovorans]